MTTLVQRQEACITRMLERRTSEKREAKNRAAALRALRKDYRKRGYALTIIDDLVKDVRDMYVLQRDSED
ncbi:MAG: hypothetical protein ABTQ25_02475 [Nitrosomonas ureae]